MKLLFLILVCFGCTLEMADREKHFIPKGFVGEVIIFFDQSHGEKIKYDEMKYRNYNIPSDGILPTKFEFNEGKVYDILKDNLFYYRAIDSTIQKLPVIYNGIEIPIIDSNQVVVFGVQNGIYEQVKYMSYHVDTLKNISKYENINWSREIEKCKKIVKEKKISPNE